MELTAIYRCIAALDVHQAKLTVCILFANKERKSMKGASTVFAQDSQSNAILYTRADILRNEEADEA